MEHESIRTQEFIKKADVVHGNRYNYDLIEYETTKKKIAITCMIHGVFLQSPEKHLAGQNCPECSKGKNMWKHDDWLDAAEKSIWFKAFQVYIIKVYDENESFYKIGRTYREIYDRFGNNNNSKFPYNYSIIKVIIGDSRYIYDLERSFHNTNAEYSYTPLKRFHGMYECYSEIDIKILEYEK